MLCAVRDLVGSVFGSLAALAWPLPELWEAVLLPAVHIAAWQLFVASAAAAVAPLSVDASAPDWLVVGEYVTVDVQFVDLLTVGKLPAVPVWEFAVEPTDDLDAREKLLDAELERINTAQRFVVQRLLENWFALQVRAPSPLA